MRMERDGERCLFTHNGLRVILHEGIWRSRIVVRCTPSLDYPLGLVASNTFWKARAREVFAESCQVLGDGTDEGPLASEMVERVFR